jgi:phage shock protein PspC (stress-responsive transcriptional regulator)
MAINPPTLVSVAGDGSGTALDVTIIPPVGGTYDYTQVWYVQVQAPRPGHPPAPLTPWQDGGQFIGTPGTEGVHKVSGLTPGYYYDFVLNAYSAADGNSIPSLWGRALAQTDTDPVIERITQDVAGVCEGISQAAGYNLDVQDVRRIRQSGIIKLSVYPAVVIQMMDDDMKDGLPVEHISNDGGLIVEGWLKEGFTEDMDRDLNLFIADIERAVLEDWRRSNNSVTTKAMRWTKFTSEEVAPYGAVRVDFVVKYRHQRGNPARQI